MKKDIKHTIHRLHQYIGLHGKDYNDSLIINLGLDRDKRVGLGIALPTTPDWCNTCNGTGGRSRYDVEGYNIGAMLDMDDDGSFREDYFGGKTDVPCNHCGGKGVIFVIDYSLLSDEQNAILDIDAKAWQDEADDQAESDAERRMGA